MLSGAWQRFHTDWQVFSNFLFEFWLESLSGQSIPFFLVFPAFFAMPVLIDPSHHDWTGTINPSLFLRKRTPFLELNSTNFLDCHPKRPLASGARKVKSDNFSDRTVWFVNQNSRQHRQFLRTFFRKTSVFPVQYSKAAKGAGMNRLILRPAVLGFKLTSE